MEIKSLRGVRDLLPEDVEKLRYIEETCRQVVRKYGFKEIIIPTIENSILYHRSIGETSDIVTKQMFEIINRNEKEEKKFVLRPEGTASVVRAFIEHNFKDKYPLKRFFYFGPMFRYEKPQKGRFREFYQFGLEIFNEPSPSSDILLIQIINDIFEKLKIEYELEINNIGCFNCRKIFVKELKEKLNDLNLCGLCRERLNKNPLRIFDCKIDLPKIKENLLNFNITKYLCDSCKKDFDEIFNLLNEQNISYKLNPFLVRGLDYYNKFVFEYKTRLLDSAQNTICAGGRYDYLFLSFGNEQIPACGAAFGVDRMMEILSDLKETRKISFLKIGIAIVNNKYLSKAFSILRTLSKIDKVVVLGPFNNKSLKAQLRLFNNENCRYIILVGEEIEKGNVVLKDFVGKTQKDIKVEQIVKYFNSEV